MRTVLLTVFLTAAGAQQGATWLKLDQAKAAAAKSGNPLLVYVACDPVTGSSSCGNAPSDRAFGESCVEKRKDNFHFVRVVDKKTAQDLKATRCGEILFLDSDGDEFYRSTFKDVRTLESAMDQALQKNGPREIAWTAYDAKKTTVSDDSKRMVFLAFVDDKKDSTEQLKALEDRSLAKFHDRFQFLRATFRRESEEVKKYAVSQAPSFVILDSSKGELLEKSSGKKSVKEVKALFVKILSKPDKK
jgi:hypothetical protein